MIIIIIGFSLQAFLSRNDQILSNPATTPIPTAHAVSKADNYKFAQITMPPDIDYSGYYENSKRIQEITQRINETAYVESTSDYDSEYEEGYQEGYWDGFNEASSTGVMYNVEKYINKALHAIECEMDENSSTYLSDAWFYLDAALDELR